MQQSEDALLCRRFAELAERAQVSGKVICSDFLNLHEQNLLRTAPPLLRIPKQLSSCVPKRNYLSSP